MNARWWQRAGCAGAAALTLGGAGREGDAFVFAPEAGTELERSWAESLELEVDSLEETLGGTPVDLPFAAIQFHTRRSFELTDVLEELAAGRPTQLLRRFAGSELAFELELDGESVGRTEGQHACGAAGVAVRFAWDDEDGRYAAERVEGQLDDELLERLEPDLDLLGLLPAAPLEPHGDFQPELEAVRALFRAGGDLGYTLTRIQLDQAGAPAEVMVAGALGSLHELFAPGSELTGTFTGHYRGRDEAEAELARLEYELDLVVTADLGERFRSFMVEASPESHALELTAEIEGRIVLAFDLAARRPRSANFEGDVALQGHLVFPLRPPQGGEAQEFVGDYELSGEGRVELVSE
jgi:hypothetical protein